MSVPLGHHIYVSKNDKDYLEIAKKNNASFVQFFLKSPQNGKEPRKETKKLLQWKKEATQNNTTIVIHASFLLNFSNNPKGYIHTNAVRLLREDLEDSIKLGAIGVVVHMGKKNTKEKKFTEEEALNNFVLGIKSSLLTTPKESIIIFETGAGCGSEICSSFFGLARLYNKFSEEEQKRIKFCIDTCHIFSTGHNLRDQYFMKKVFYPMVDVTIGWKNVICIHLNDSLTPLGSKKDRHGDLGKGYIGDKALSCFVNECYARKIPLVMETPQLFYDNKGNYFKDESEERILYTWKEQLDKVKDWVKK